VLSSSFLPSIGAKVAGLDGTSIARYGLQESNESYDWGSEVGMKCGATDLL
jgi:hypothetical protein